MPPLFDLGPTKGPSNWMWVTEPRMGTWRAEMDNPCEAALAETAAVCANEPLPIVGRWDRPLVALPEQSDFLIGAPFYAATTGDLVLSGFEDLPEAQVEPEFVQALTFPENAAELYLWRGPVTDGDPGGDCEGWTNAGPTAAVSYFEASSTAVSPVMAPCESLVALLCACAAAE